MTGDEIIQRDDAQAIREQEIDEMRRHKPRPAGNDCCFLIHSEEAEDVWYFWINFSDSVNAIPVT